MDILSLLGTRRRLNDDTSDPGSDAIPPKRQRTAGIMAPPPVIPIHPRFPAFSVSGVDALQLLVWQKLGPISSEAYSLSNVVFRSTPELTFHRVDYLLPFASKSESCVRLFNKSDAVVHSCHGQYRIVPLASPHAFTVSNGDDHIHEIRSVDMATDDSAFVIVTPRSLAVVDSKTNRAIGSAKALNHFLAAKFNAAASVVAAGGHQGEVSLWDIRASTAARIYVKLGKLPLPLNFVHWLSEFRLITGSASSGSIQICDIRKPKAPVAVLETHSRRGVASLDVDRQAGLMWIVSRDNQIRVHSLGALPSEAPLVEFESPLTGTAGILANNVTDGLLVSNDTGFVQFPLPKTISGLGFLKRDLAAYPVNPTDYEIDSVVLNGNFTRAAVCGWKTGEEYSTVVEYIELE
ncbi:hypothetical protein BABINDRAFT_8510 [Babjeviella inositovora NRRL Y-12698]|uniref:DUF2415 domain-containing protein n=1 Tax=Babjeviella inositovora NRRL Y-12698 TaxID=984486 RepID=A0A1E3QPH0_9ASCO|nr:uncharacterized protein BABINDRAFT_8510 [Babjeviella inositovora NRRL Y-12698]ODQ79606.1 hypothetical protein BABINDRAFT_8510 [Babjeviella inositovora NRRL Y-12698]